MSDNVILAQQTMEGFGEVEESAGVYAAQKEQALSLTEGETYTVAWDGTEYSCIAVSMDGAMALGNLSLAGISSLDYREPFVIGCVSAALTGGADMLMIYTTDAGESHTVAIAVEGLITINRYGDKEYHYGIQTLTLDTTTEKHQRVHTKGVKTEKSVALDMADGDLIIEPDPSTLLGKVTVQKPETMAPENIRNGVEIGGVHGSFIGDTEEITVDLNMADGDQIALPSDDGKVISKVTIQKPETLVPEHVKKDVVIAGVRGTLEDSVGTGGGGEEKNINFYDYDGTLLYSYTVEEAQALTELPALPSCDGLICQGWNWTLEDIKAEGDCVDVGAQYITDDGKTRLYLTFNTSSRCTPTLNFNQSVENGIEVDWGDGSDVETLAGTGNVSISHTYDGVGDYCISLNPIGDCILKLGNGPTGNNLFGGNSVYGNSVYKNCLKRVEIGRNVSLNSAVFQKCYSLTCVSVPSLSDKVIQQYNFDYSGIKYLTIPNGVTTVGNYVFRHCTNLKTVSIPKSVTLIGSYAFSGSCIKRICLPNTVATLGTYAFYQIFELEYIRLGNTLTKVSGYCFHDSQVPKFILPATVTTIGEFVFEYGTGIAEIIALGNITSIGNQAFCGCGARIIDLSKCTAVPSLGSSALSSVASDCEIRVPTALYDSWIAASGWSSYASKIVGV